MFIDNKKGITNILLILMRDQFMIIQSSKFLIRYSQLKLIVPTKYHQVQVTLKTKTIEEVKHHNKLCNKYNLLNISSWATYHAETS